jgi:hypothetical protein
MSMPVFDPNTGILIPDWEGYPNADISQPKNQPWTLPGSHGMYPRLDTPSAIIGGPPPQAQGLGTEHLIALLLWLLFVATLAWLVWKIK